MLLLSLEFALDGARVCVSVRVCVRVCGGVGGDI